MCPSQYSEENGSLSNFVIDKSTAPQAIDVYPYPDSDEHEFLAKYSDEYFLLAGEQWIATIISPRYLATNSSN